MTDLRALLTRAGEALGNACLVVEEITDKEGREGLTDYDFAEQVIALAHQYRDGFRALHTEITAALTKDSTPPNSLDDPVASQMAEAGSGRVVGFKSQPEAPYSQPAPDDGWRPQWHHRKRGSEYVMVGRGEVQAEEPLTEAELVAVYRGQDGRLWVRRWAEFHDGRFEELTHYEL